MPNHVLNRLTIPNVEDAKEAFDFMGAAENRFDFEQICPIPPHIWTYSYKRVDETTVEFETAWNAVPRIILLLVHKIGINEFTYEWADEDFGSNTGRITGEDCCGDLHIDIYKPEDQTEEAFHMAALVRPDYVKTDENKEGFIWNKETKEIDYIEGDSE